MYNILIIFSKKVKRNISENINYIREREREIYTFKQLIL